MAKTSKELATEALKWANEKYPKASQGQQIKVGILKFILDEAGVSEDDLRKGAVDAFMATPSWFGASANAMTESGVIEARKRGEKTVGGFEA